MKDDGSFKKIRIWLSLSFSIYIYFLWFFYYVYALITNIYTFRDFVTATLLIIIFSNCIFLFEYYLVYKNMHKLFSREISAHKIFLIQIPLHFLCGALSWTMPIAVGFIIDENKIIDPMAFFVPIPGAILGLIYGVIISLIILKKRIRGQFGGHIT